MAKTTIGYQAENQFHMKAKGSSKKKSITGYSFHNPRDNRNNAISPENYDFLCDVMHPAKGLLKDVKVEIKTSGRASFELTAKETELALAKGTKYDDNYLIVFYRHTKLTAPSYRFSVKVISSAEFSAARPKLRIKG